MKRILVITGALLVLLNVNSQAQGKLASLPATNRPYETIEANNELTLKGLLNRKVLESDTTFKWFKNNYALGTTDASAVQSFQKNKDRFHVIIFGGTWCEDTQNLLPVFYLLPGLLITFPNMILMLQPIRRHGQQWRPACMRHLVVKMNCTSVRRFLP